MRQPRDSKCIWGSILPELGIVGLCVLITTFAASAQNNQSDNGNSDPGPARLVATVPIARPLGVAVNTTTNRIYVANAISESGNGLWMIDGETLTASQRFFASADQLPFGVAVNPMTNKVYLSSLPASITALDEVTGSMTTIPVPAGVFLMAVDPTTNRIYVTNNGLGFTGAVTVIDGTTNSLIGNIPVESGPWGVAVNLVTNRVYVANNGSSSVSVIDSTTDTVIATVPLPAEAAPRGMAVNETTNRIYVAIPNSGVAVIDGDSNTLVGTIPSSSLPLDAAVNPSNNRVYVTTYGSQTVDVIDGQRGTVVGGVLVSGNTHGVAVDSTRSRVYASRSPGAEGIAVIAECLRTDGNFVCPPEQLDILRDSGRGAHR